MNRKTYRLAKEVSPEFGDSFIKPFGPLFTLQQAESYAEEMRKGGFEIMVINTQAE